MAHSGQVLLAKREPPAGFAIPFDPDLGGTVSIVSSAFAVDRAAISAPTRRAARVALARQVAMYVAHVGQEMTLTEIGVRFGRDRTTAAYACRLVEDRRDDPGFDLALDYLEWAVLKQAAFAADA